jgi:ribosomal protein S18 acetylase RimI-like enzyme
MTSTDAVSRGRLALEPLAVEHIERGAALVSAAFADEYSWVRAVGMTDEGHRSWMQCDYLPKRANDAAVPSLVAMLRSDESALPAAMAGVCAIEDFVSLPSVDENEDRNADMPPGLTAMHALVDECTAIFWRSAFDEDLIDALAIDMAAGKPKAPPRGRFGYVAYLAVDSAHRRQHVGDQLLAAADAQFAAAGFSHSVAFCTSHRSRALFSAREYSYCGGVSYQNFEMPDRSRPFASMPRDECAVMVREL